MQSIARFPLLSTYAEIGFEWPPFRFATLLCGIGRRPAHPLSDRTAFDAFIEYRTTDGKLFFLGIETKYTEPFSEKAYESTRYRALTTPEKGFSPGAADVLLQSVTNQLWRNTLLAIAHHSANQYLYGHVIIVAPAGDTGAFKAFVALSDQLAEPASRLRNVALETIVDHAKAEPRLAEWARASTRPRLLVRPSRSKRREPVLNLMRETDRET
ncbi:MAG: hypothetical protein H0U74_04990 [Bradymonadaceae bacterium]|nr:hypothetical protein [Lujinxingiaceae bacterium]